MMITDGEQNQRIVASSIILPGVPQYLVVILGA